MDHNKTKKPSLSISKKIIFIFIIIFVLIVCVEAALRFAGFSYYGLSSHLYSSFCFDKDLRYRMLPGNHRIGDMEFHVNKWGYRGRDWGEKKIPGIFRIMAIGDSSTFGYSNQDDETYPRILENLLKNRGENVEVLNMGVVAYSSWGSVLDYKLRGSKFEPDMFIIFLGNWNDFHPVYRHPDITEKEYFRDYVSKGEGSGDYTRPWYTFLKLGQVFLKMKDSFIQRSESQNDKVRLTNGYYIEDKPEFVRRVSLSEFEENLEFFVNEGKKRNIPVIFIIPKLKPRRAMEKPICNLYRNKVRNIQTENGIELLDLDAIFQNQNPDEIWQDDGFHFKPKGNHMIAGSLLSIMESSRLMPNQNKMNR